MLLTKLRHRIYIIVCVLSLVFQEDLRLMEQNLPGILSSVIFSWHLADWISELRLISFDARRQRCIRSLWASCVAPQ